MLMNMSSSFCNFCMRALQCKKEVPLIQIKEVDASIKQEIECPF